MPALDDLRVLDFSTLLPGPMASLLLAEAGADVIKVERPVSGEDMRGYPGRFGSASVNFALLNRGKCSVAADLKSPGDVARILELARDADVLIEQFRPGVMDRLGLGYAAIRDVNSRIVYCSITGYGQHGPQAAKAAHDLDYMAEAGLLDLVRGGDGAPALPPVLTADIAGGAYPAVMNILLALRDRDRRGEGAKLDVAMSDNLFILAYWGLGAGFAQGEWPRPGGELVTGGSPRYRIYRTSDDRFLAVAPLEEKFWREFCDVIELAAAYRDDLIDPRATTAAVAQRIVSATAAQWQERFAGRDCCVSVVATLAEAAASPAFAARGLFERRLTREGGHSIPALPVPLDPGLRNDAQVAGYPERLEPISSVAWSNPRRAPPAASTRSGTDATSSNRPNPGPASSGRPDPDSPA